MHIIKRIKYTIGEIKYYRPAISMLYKKDYKAANALIEKYFSYIGVDEPNPQAGIINGLIQYRLENFGDGINFIAHSIPHFESSSWKFSVDDIEYMKYYSLILILNMCDKIGINFEDSPCYLQLRDSNYSNFDINSVNVSLKYDFPINMMKKFHIPKSQETS